MRRCEEKFNFFESIWIVDAVTYLQLEYYHQNPKRKKDAVIQCQAKAGNYSTNTEVMVKLLLP